MADLERSGRALVFSVLLGMVVALIVGVGASHAEMDEGMSRSYDTHAPPGAPAHWLPHDAWVSQHWLPFDEGRFHQLLGISRGDVWSLLEDSRYTFVGLAKKRGFTVTQLATKLLEPRKSSLGAHKYRVLLQRSKDMITQGHLAQHVFFHSLHESRIPQHAAEIFGVSTAKFRTLRRKKFSPFQIGEMRGHTRLQMLRDTVAQLRASAREGVRNKDMTKKQAKLLLARQIPKESWWLQAAILPHFFRAPH